LLNETTAYPDTYYREADPNEPPRHFIDLEIWNPKDPSTGILLKFGLILLLLAQA
jgi:hypothetical protein